MDLCADQYDLLRNEPSRLGGINTRRLPLATNVVQYSEHRARVRNAANIIYTQCAAVMRHAARVQWNNGRERVIFWQATVKPLVSVLFCLLGTGIRPVRTTTSYNTAGDRLRLCSLANQPSFIT